MRLSLMNMSIYTMLPGGERRQRVRDDIMSGPYRVIAGYYGNKAGGQVNEEIEMVCAGHRHGGSGDDRRWMRATGDASED
jgi:hypothetical protein